MSNAQDIETSIMTLKERLTIIEQGWLSNNIDNALRLAWMQGLLDGLTARVNGIDATLVAQAYCIDALQLKPTEPTSTPEHCHIDGCVNPLPPYIFPFCAKCGLPTCTAHVYEHPAPLEDDADNTAGWCKTCHDTATIPAQTFSRAWVRCHIDGCTRDLPDDIDLICANCGLGMCTFHAHKHTSRDSDVITWWCAACEPNLCHIAECRNHAYTETWKNYVCTVDAVTCDHCHNRTCPSHLTKLGIEFDEDDNNHALYWCADCIAKMNTPATDESLHCHMHGCTRDLPDDIDPTCANCGLPTCKFHTFEHHVPATGDEEEYWQEWCAACEPGICHIETCRNRILQGYRGECTRCGDTTCKDHLTMLGIEVDEDDNNHALYWCDDCIAEINTTAPATDDGPSTCYICCRLYDIEDCATCMTCLRTVCHDHSALANLYIDMTKRVCKACGYGTVDEELVTTLLERNYLRRTNTELERELIPLRGLEYADDAIEELQCQLLDAQQEHTKSMRQALKHVKSIKRQANILSTIALLDIDFNDVPESEDAE